MPLGRVFNQIQRFAQLGIFGRVGDAAAEDVVFVFRFGFGTLFFAGRSVGGLRSGIVFGRGAVLPQIALHIGAAQGVAQVAAQIGFTAFKFAVFVLHFHIRGDALCLNRAVVGGVV